MSIFGTIKNAILGHPAVEAQNSAPKAPAPQADVPAAAPMPSPTAAPAQPELVDADAAIAKIAKAKGDPDLHWQTSIVDLMKLLGLDPSLANREELAIELGYAGEKNGSAEMNEWLHDAVMNRIRTGK